MLYSPSSLRPSGRFLPTMPCTVTVEGELPCRKENQLSVPFSLSVAVKTALHHRRKDPLYSVVSSNTLNFFCLKPQHHSHFLFYCSLLFLLYTDVQYFFRNLDDSLTLFCQEALNSRITVLFQNFLC